MSDLSLEFITVEEFKGSKIFDKTLSKANNYNDHYIQESITMVCMRMDFFCNGLLYEKLNDKDNPLSDINIQCIKDAAFIYVAWMLRGGLDQQKGSGSGSLGSINWSFNNPSDPFYIPIEVVAALERAKLLGNVLSFNSLNASSNKQEDFYNFQQEDRPANFTYNEMYNNFVSFKNISSSDKSINIDWNVAGFPRVLDLKVNLSDTIKSEISKYIYSIEEELTKRIFNDILNDSGYTQEIETKVGQLLENDDNWNTTIEKAIESLAVQNDEFTTKIADNIVKSSPSVTKIAGASYPLVKNGLAEDQGFIATLASSETAAKEINKAVIKDVTALNNDIYLGLIKDSKLDINKYDTTTHEPTGTEQVTIIDSINTIKERLTFKVNKEDKKEALNLLNGAKGLPGSGYFGYNNDVEGNDFIYPNNVYNSDFPTKAKDLVSVMKEVMSIFPDIANFGIKTFTSANTFGEIVEFLKTGVIVLSSAIEGNVYNYLYSFDPADSSNALYLGHIKIDSSAKTGELQIVMHESTKNLNKSINIYYIQKKT